MEKFKVFVYGTLKKGFGNNYLLRDSKFIGEATTVEKYALYISGIPFVTKDEKISHIQGEVFEVTKETLLKLDSLEGHPNWYKREEIFVTLNKSKKKLKAWIYFNPTPGGTLEPSGSY